jgi:uncharacterized protein
VVSKLKPKSNQHITNLWETRHRPLGTRICIYLVPLAKTTGYTTLLFQETNMIRSEILKILKQYKIENSKKYGINSIGIFGSYSVGLTTEESDIDVVVETKYPDLYTLVHIKEELEELFSKPVDIVRNRKNMNLTS